eukprot:m.205260 g.205260  ORF g.205260 m.205260 type:complete len:442 (-) comp17756_c0_seq2:901-2226(-)
MKLYSTYHSLGFFCVPAPLLALRAGFAEVDLELLLPVVGDKRLEAAVGGFVDHLEGRLVVDKLLIALLLVAALQVDVARHAVGVVVQTQVVACAQLVVVRVHPHLVDARAVAEVDANHAAGALAHLVDALPVGIAQCALVLHVLRVWDEHVRHNVVHVPLKRLALEVLPQLHAVGDVAVGNGLALRAGGVKVLFEVVHPHFSSAGRVGEERIVDGGAWNGVRMGLAEDVADMRAGRGDKGAAALPDPEGDFQILSAPATHSPVVFAELVEVRAVNREQSAGHCGRVDGVGVRVALLNDACLPCEVHGPAERSHSRDVGDIRKVLHRLVADGIDDGCDHGGAVLVDDVENGLEPSDVGLDVAVQKGQHGTDGVLGAHHACADQAETLGRPHILDKGRPVLLHVLQQVIAKPCDVAGVVQEDDFADELVRRAVQNAPNRSQEG